MRNRRVIAAPGDQPIVDVNTTPLIDVMLVLLIMFILTIPTQTHQVPLDLPQPSPTPPRERSVHQLRIDAAGGLTLNGTRIDQSALPGRLRTVAADGASELHLSADAETPYERFDQVLAAVRRAGVTRLGMDNHRFAGAVD